jgi:hypothetical protein
MQPQGPEITAVTPLSVSSHSSSFSITYIAEKICASASQKKFAQLRQD